MVLIRLGQKSTRLGATQLIIQQGRWRTDHHLFFNDCMYNIEQSQLLHGEMHLQEHKLKLKTVQPTGESDKWAENATATQIRKT